LPRSSSDSSPFRPIKGKSLLNTLIDLPFSLVQSLQPHQHAVGGADSVSDGEAHKAGPLERKE
jgi:hypothetical protein